MRDLYYVTVNPQTALDVTLFWTGSILSVDEADKGVFLLEPCQRCADYYNGIKPEYGSYANEQPRQTNTTYTATVHRF